MNALKMESANYLHLQVEHLVPYHVRNEKDERNFFLRNCYLRNCLFKMKN